MCIRDSPGTPLPRVKHSGGFPVITVIVTGMLALFGFLGYQILKDKEEPVAKEMCIRDRAYAI